MNPLFKDEFHAEITPVPAGLPRPLWSVLIPTHNCARYLELALGSVLEQDPGPECMEIIVVDDHSTQDDPEAVVRRLAGERVRFIQQPANVGKVRNYETGLLASRGMLIHQLHGDDRVCPGFYERMGAFFDQCPAAAAAFCRSIYVDGNGKWLGITGAEQYEDGISSDFLARIVIAQRIQTPAMVVKREAYEKLGGFDRRLHCMEDWEMWIRLAAHYPIGFANEVLAEYRTHADNATSETLLDGSALSTHALLLKITDAYLPLDLRRRVTAKRALEQALFFIDSANALKLHNRTRAHALLWHALRLSWQPKVVFRAIKVLRVGQEHPMK
jgi:glycosyltransferase involved in cell wall biosynthesis